MKELSLLLLLVGSSTAWVPTHVPSHGCSRLNPLNVASDVQQDVQYALYFENQRALTQQAEIETEWMGELPDLESYSQMVPAKAAEAALRKRVKQRTKKQKKIPAGKGFGGGGGGKAARPALPPISREAAALGISQAAVLEEQGVVRINGALSRESTAILRATVLEERAAAEAAVAEGMSSSKRFGDLMLSGKRRDVLLPLADAPGAPAVVAALEELFGPEGTLLGLYDALVGESAVLYELAALVSEPGAVQQTIHADMPYQNQCALYTGFMALQDIEPHMGPTTFVPHTHVAEAHDKLAADISVREEFLSSAGARIALLRAGDIAIFDSRALHAGGANHAELGSTRALFYFSITNPDAGKFETGTNMASIRPGYAAVPIDLGQLRRGISEAAPFSDRGDGLGPEGDELTTKRDAYRRKRNTPDGCL